MGMYLNPGNQAFAGIVNGDYTDKTGLIDVVNRTILTPERLTCISRPRRFGKSFAANMLIAYYDHTCDSHELFRGYEVSRCGSYEEHLNQYNVIALDITGFISSVKSSERNNKDVRDLPDMIEEAIKEDVVEEYPDLSDVSDFSKCLRKYVERTGRKFVFVIDEWDAVIREAKDDKLIQERYLNLLRMLFKNNNFTPYAVAACYMTGILPIKKDGSQSAISDFKEYSILDPGAFAAYTGFTEDEVRAVCSQYDMRFDEAEKWYDGYNVGEETSIYNPYSVMMAMQRKKYASYWRKTSTAESLVRYINMDFDGLREDMARLIAGEEIEVYTEDFANDFETFTSKDDVLTLMIHLGYLAYDRETGCVKIPNEEVRGEFNNLVRKADRNQLAGLVKASEQLLSDTLAGNADAVVAAIEKVRDSNYAPGFYNNEQALRYVIKFAYIVCVDRYMKIEELPSGHGIADVVYIPKRNRPDPALVVELKWNQSSEAALAQIKDKNYPAVLADYGGEIILVGMNYDPEKKEHSCMIERIRK